MTEVAFLTLFLGLTAGVQDVGLDVRGPTARVELWLDGQRIAEQPHAPWQMRIDLGPALLPHLLEARALDARGKVVARRTQRLNLPRSAAETQILLERDADGKAIAARLVWQSLTHAAPSRVSVSVDGRPLTMGTSGRIELPALKPDAVHVLSAELRFPAGVIARSDLAFGADVDDAVQGDLTGVPIAGAGMRPPAPAALAGALAVRGEARDVNAAEQGSGVVIVVREPTAVAGLLRGASDSRASAGQPGLPSASVGGASAFGEPRLASSDSLRFIWPWTASSSSVDVGLFPDSPDLNASDGPLLQILRDANSGTPVATARLRLADAVAVAGLQATYRGERRLVLLVLGNEETDTSQFGVAAVREYLHAIHVPLVIWRTVSPGDKRGAKPESAWGEGELVDSQSRLRRAGLKLLEILTAQRMVWVEGGHLPSDITLSAEARAKGLRFADE